MIHTVLLDLDGTLFNKQQSVSDLNKKTIVTLIEQGIDVYLVTGRPYFFANHIASKIHHQLKIIAADGAVYQLGEDIVVNTISNESLNKIVDYVKDKPIHAHFKSLDTIYTRKNLMRIKDVYLSDEYINLFEDVEIIISNSFELLRKEININKIFVRCPDQELFNEMKNYLEKNEIANLNSTWYTGLVGNVVPLAISKAHAIEEIAKFKNISISEMMAFGDSDNDVLMFEAVGHSVAMKNASNEIKRVTRYVTDRNNDEDGVAKFLINYFNL